MIARLRARHRAAFAGLACVMPLLAWAALSRRPPEAIASAPLVDRGDQGAFALRLFLADGSSSCETRGTGVPGVRVDLASDWNEPDAFLCWTPDAPSGGSLPADAEFVGAIGAAPDQGFALRADQLHGWFSVYSLARRAIAASVPIPTDPLVPVCDYPAGGS